jgi:hypothetical protein
MCMDHEELQTHYTLRNDKVFWKNQKYDGGPQFYTRLPSYLSGSKARHFPTAKRSYKQGGYHAWFNRMAAKRWQFMYGGAIVKVRVKAGTKVVYGKQTGRRCVRAMYMEEA